MFATKDEALAKLESKLPEWAAKITDLGRPCVTLQSGPGDAEIPLGASKLGGWPDLANNTPWPVREAYRYDNHRWLSDSDIARRRASAPLAFIAQFDLAEIGRADSAGLPLPGEGRLLVFYDREVEPWGFDPNDGPGLRVIWDTAPIEELERTAPPAALVEQNASAKEARFDLAAGFTLPPADDIGVQNLTLPEAAIESYIDVYCEGSGRVQHQIGGWPAQIQNPMELECQLVTNGIYCGTPEGFPTERAAALSAGAKDWMLLLQIDSDEVNSTILWGDCGRLYVWIRRQDLAARRFDRAWAILQCY